MFKKAEESSKEYRQMEELVAQIIDPEVMDGGSEGGNLDVAEVLDKASEIMEEVKDWAVESVKADIVEALQEKSMVLVSGEELSDLKEKVSEIADTLDGDLQDADSWIEDLEL